ncbi:ATP-binding cassette domain-containing protein [Arthrobacter sp. ISL-95]|uniref:ATP-binding cassette domain-containing protein n=1 Tax=Arthrobacter sp. ISL-95 TaxID=2819116 RepID=UPI001BED11B4|nr:ATP-binding cassette domain-containing protein [Arthrobacter sp. ISL-95]MBT2587145.1 ABC transporter ATP-binding protein [Arthrobacter sp. ISL-95]
MSSLLEVRDLTVMYRGRGRRKDKVALEGVSVSLNEGETLGLVGESGSGKSTLGNTVLGLVRPERGRIGFDGNDIAGLTGAARRKLSTQIQAVFQDPYTSFNPHRTIEQSMGETLANSPPMSRRETRARVLAMLERVGLDSTALSKFPAQFSGGQRQRISIARALLPEPRLVVCDESVSALDLSVQAQILNLLLELQRERGVAYLFITHDLSVVRHMSTRIAVLEHGKLIEQGDAAGVTDEPSQPYTRRLISASLSADAELQRDRRSTRRAMTLLAADATGDRSKLADEVLRTLEHQAVTEVFAQLVPQSRALALPLSRGLAGVADVDGVTALRAAVLELAPRTAEAMTPAAMLTFVQEARARKCSALFSRGQSGMLYGLIRDLAVAIETGDRARALELVGSFDEPLEPSPHPNGARAGEHTIESQA